MPPTGLDAGAVLRNSSGTEIGTAQNPLVTSDSGGSGGGAVTVADGADVTQGAKADAKSTATDTTPISLMSVFKQVSASAQAIATSIAGTLTVAAHAVTQSGTWTVQPGNTANTTAWKVDGSAVTQPVSGSLTGITTSIVPGTGATNLGKAEDAAHASGDVGVLLLGIRTDTTAARSGTDGDYEGIQLVGGAVAVQQAGLTPSTDQVALGAKASGGWTPHKLVSAATTNATSLKASPGQVGAIYATNINAAIRYLKLYNKASAPTVGTDTPVATLGIPGGGTAGAGGEIAIPAGLEFTTGIAYATTTEITDAGTTGVAASEIAINIAWK